MNFEIGQSVIVELAKSRGYCHWGAVVERIEPCTVFVRLVGFGETGLYQAGDYVPVNPDKVQAMGGWNTASELQNAGLVR
jgi:hypothetical protein